MNYRRDSILKSGEISWRCSLNRQKRKAKIRTDADSTTILSGTLDHNHPASDRSLERKLVRNRVKRKATEDISSRPAKVIKNELCASNEENLKPSDITSLRQALYRERRNKFPKLPSSIEEVSDVLNFLKPINTSKDEDLLLVNDADSRIVIFSSPTNLKFLCDDVSEIYADGTFKCCPKFFTQLYTIHGFKNRHYLQLVYCLLPNKSEQCYLTMIDLLKGCISEQGLSFQPEKINLDFEIAAHSALRASFPNATPLCCRFHLGQAWYRNIQKLGLDTDSEIGK